MAIHIHTVTVPQPSSLDGRQGFGFHCNATYIIITVAFIYNDPILRKALSLSRRNFTHLALVGQHLITGRVFCLPIAS